MQIHYDKIRSNSLFLDGYFLGWVNDLSIHKVGIDSRHNKGGLISALNIKKITYPVCLKIDF